jgi:hypothetical protein
LLGGGLVHEGGSPIKYNKDGSIAIHSKVLQQLLGGGGGGAGPENCPRFFFFQVVVEMLSIFVWLQCCVLFTE